MSQQVADDADDLLILQKTSNLIAVSDIRFWAEDVTRSVSA